MVYMDMQKRRILVAGIVLAVVLGVGYFSTDVLQTFSIVCCAVAIVLGVISSIQMKRQNKK